MMNPTTPSTSRNNNYAFTPHRKGSALKSSAKTIVMNVTEKLKTWFPNDSAVDLVQKTAELTGVSERSIYKMQKEFANNGSFSTPGKERPARKGKATRLEKYDSFTKAAVRQNVHGFFKRNEIPTVAKVKEVINEDPQLPTISTETTRMLMKDLGFVFQKRSRNSMLIEREDIQVWRRKYIRQIRKYREDEKHIYYTDETWVNFGHTKQKVWQDTFIKKPRDAFLSGLSTGLQAPSGKGSRLILTHAGSVEGFVEQAVDIFKAKKGKGDYHEEMNGEYYEDWFKNKLIPHLASESVIVIDNASYHTVNMENIPTKSTKKKEIQEWLTAKGITWEEDMLKNELLEIVSTVRSKYVAYRIDEIAKEHGHTVLRLPPYHCELNPIELIWSKIKGKVAQENKTFKQAEVLELTKAAIDTVTPEDWKNCIKHVIKEEDSMWAMDNMCDAITVDPVVITYDPESTESASEGESMSCDEV